jgi:hypothetical protein
MFRVELVWFLRAAGTVTFSKKVKLKRLCMLASDETQGAKLVSIQAGEVDTNE